MSNLFEILNLDSCEAKDGEKGEEQVRNGGEFDRRESSQEEANMADKNICRGEVDEEIQSPPSCESNIEVSDIQEESGSEKESAPLQPIKSFIIPRKKKKSKDLLHKIPLTSREYTKDISPIITKSYREHTSRTRFLYEEVYMVHNEELTKEFQEKRKEMKNEGRTEKELSESHAFYSVDNMEQAKEICKHGLRVDNSPVTCLGNPSMGVYVSRYSDLINRSIVSVGTQAVLIIFKLIKGKVKAVTECHQSWNIQEPIPNFDCHVSKTANINISNLTTQQAHDSTQIYLYEFGDLDMVERPRHLCPYAIVSFRYQALPKSSPHSSQLSMTTPPRTSTSIRGPSTPPVMGGPPLGTKIVPIFKNPASLEAGQYETMNDNGYALWSGLFCNKTKLMCNVKILSYASPIQPVQIPSTVNLCLKMPVSKLRVHLAPRIFIKGLPINTGEKEVFVDGKYYVYCEARAMSDFKGSLSRFMKYLESNRLAAVVQLAEMTELFLLPTSQLTHDLGMTAPNYPMVLHGLFVSFKPTIRHIKVLGAMNTARQPGEDSNTFVPVLGEPAIDSSPAKVMEARAAVAVAVDQQRMHQMRCASKPPVMSPSVLRRPTQQRSSYAAYGADGVPVTTDTWQDPMSSIRSVAQPPSGVAPSQPRPSFAAADPRQYKYTTQTPAIPPVPHSPQGAHGQLPPLHSSSNSSDISQMQLPNTQGPDRNEAPSNEGQSGSGDGTDLSSDVSSFLLKIPNSQAITADKLNRILEKLKPLLDNPGEDAETAGAPPSQAAAATASSPLPAATLPSAAATPTLSEPPTATLASDLSPAAVTPSAHLPQVAATATRLPARVTSYSDLLSPGELASIHKDLGTSPGELASMQKELRTSTVSKFPQQGDVRKVVIGDRESSGAATYKLNSKDGASPIINLDSLQPEKGIDKRKVIDIKLQEYSTKIQELREELQRQTGGKPATPSDGSVELSESDAASATDGASAYSVRKDKETWMEDLDETAAEKKARHRAIMDINEMKAFLDQTCSSSRIDNADDMKNYLNATVQKGGKVLKLKKRKYPESSGVESTEKGGADKKKPKGMKQREENSKNYKSKGVSSSYQISEIKNEFDKLPDTRTVHKDHKTSETSGGCTSSGREVTESGCNKGSGKAAVIREEMGCTTDDVLDVAVEFNEFEVDRGMGEGKEPRKEVATPQREDTETPQRDDRETTRRDDTAKPDDEEETGCTFSSAFAHHKVEVDGSEVKITAKCSKTKIEKATGKTNEEKLRMSVISALHSGSNGSDAEDLDNDELIGTVLSVLHNLKDKSVGENATERQVVRNEWSMEDETAHNESLEENHSCEGVTPSENKRIVEVLKNREDHKFVSKPPPGSSAGGRSSDWTRSSGSLDAGQGPRNISLRPKSTVQAGGDGRSKSSKPVEETGGKESVGKSSEARRGRKLIHIRDITEKRRFHPYGKPSQPEKKETSSVEKDIEKLMQNLTSTSYSSKNPNGRGSPTADFYHTKPTGSTPARFKSCDLPARFRQQGSKPTAVPMRVDSSDDDGSVSQEDPRKHRPKEFMEKLAAYDSVVTRDDLEEGQIPDDDDDDESMSAYTSNSNVQESCTRTVQVIHGGRTIDAYIPTGQAIPTLQGQNRQQLLQPQANFFRHANLLREIKGREMCQLPRRHGSTELPQIHCMLNEKRDICPSWKSKPETTPKSSDCNRCSCRRSNCSPVYSDIPNSSTQSTKTITSTMSTGLQATRCGPLGDDQNSVSGIGGQLCFATLTKQEMASGGNVVEHDDLSCVPMELDNEQEQRKYEKENDQHEKTKTTDELSVLLHSSVNVSRDPRLRKRQPNKDPQGKALESQPLLKDISGNREITEILRSSKKLEAESRKSGMYLCKSSSDIIQSVRQRTKEDQLMSTFPKPTHSSSVKDAYMSLSNLCSHLNEQHSTDTVKPQSSEMPRDDASPQSTGESTEERIRCWLDSIDPTEKDKDSAKEEEQTDKTDVTDSENEPHENAATAKEPSVGKKVKISISQYKKKATHVQMDNVDRFKRGGESEQVLPTCVRFGNEKQMLTKTAPASLTIHLRRKIPEDGKVSKELEASKDLPSLTQRTTPSSTADTVNHKNGYSMTVKKDHCEENQNQDEFWAAIGPKHRDDSWKDGIPFLSIKSPEQCSTSFKENDEFSDTILEKDSTDIQKAKNGQASSALPKSIGDVSQTLSPNLHSKSSVCASSTSKSSPVYASLADSSEYEEKNKDNMITEIAKAQSNSKALSSKENSVIEDKLDFANSRDVTTSSDVVIKSEEFSKDVHLEDKFSKSSRAVRFQELRAELGEKTDEMLKTMFQYFEENCSHLDEFQLQTFGSCDVSKVTGVSGSGRRLHPLSKRSLEDIPKHDVDDIHRCIQEKSEETLKSMENEFSKIFSSCHRISEDYSVKSETRETFYKAFSDLKKEIMQVLVNYGVKLHALSSPLNLLASRKNHLEHQPHPPQCSKKSSSGGQLCVALEKAKQNFEQEIDNILSARVPAEIDHKFYGLSRKYDSITEFISKGEHSNQGACIGSSHGRICQILKCNQTENSREARVEGGILSKSAPMPYMNVQVSPPKSEDAKHSSTPQDGLPIPSVHQRFSRPGPSPIQQFVIPVIRNQKKEIHSKPLPFPQYLEGAPLRYLVTFPEKNLDSSNHSGSQLHQHQETNATNYMGRKIKQESVNSQFHTSCSWYSNQLSAELNETPPRHLHQPATPPSGLHRDYIQNDCDVRCVQSEMPQRSGQAIQRQLRWNSLETTDKSDSQSCHFHPACGTPSSLAFHDIGVPDNSPPSHTETESRHYQCSELPSTRQVPLLPPPSEEVNKSIHGFRHHDSHAATLPSTTPADQLTNEQSKTPSTERHLSDIQKKEQSRRENDAFYPDESELFPSSGDVDERAFQYPVTSTLREESSITFRKPERPLSPLSKAISDFLASEKKKSSLRKALSELASGMEVGFDNTPSDRGNAGTVVNYSRDAHNLSHEEPYTAQHAPYLNKVAGDSRPSNRPDLKFGGHTNISKKEKLYLLNAEDNPLRKSEDLLHKHQLDLHIGIGGRSDTNKQLQQEKTPGSVVADRRFNTQDETRFSEKSRREHVSAESDVLYCKEKPFSDSLAKAASKTTDKVTGEGDDLVNMLESDFRKETYAQPDLHLKNKTGKEKTSAINYSKEEKDPQKSFKKEESETEMVWSSSHPHVESSPRYRKTDSVVLHENKRHQHNLEDQKYSSGKIDNADRMNGTRTTSVGPECQGSDNRDAGSYGKGRCSRRESSESGRNSPSVSQVYREEYLKAVRKYNSKGKRSSSSDSCKSKYSDSEVTRRNDFRRSVGHVDGKRRRDSSTYRDNDKKARRRARSVTPEKKKSRLRSQDGMDSDKGYRRQTKHHSRASDDTAAKCQKEVDSISTDESIERTKYHSRDTSANLKSDSRPQSRSRRYNIRSVSPEDRQGKDSSTYQNIRSRKRMEDVRTRSVSPGRRIINYTPREKSEQSSIRSMNPEYRQGKGSSADQDIRPLRKMEDVRTRSISPERRIGNHVQRENCKQHTIRSISPEYRQDKSSSADRNIKSLRKMKGVKTRSISPERRISRNLPSEKLGDSNQNNSQSDITRSVSPRHQTGRYSHYHDFDTRMQTRKVEHVHGRSSSQESFGSYSHLPCDTTLDWDKDPKPHKSDSEGFKGESPEGMRSSFDKDSRVSEHRPRCITSSSVDGESYHKPSFMSKDLISRTQNNSGYRRSRSVSPSSRKDREKSIDQEGGRRRVDDHFRTSSNEGTFGSSLSQNTISAKFPDDDKHTVSHSEGSVTPELGRNRRTLDHDTTKHGDIPVELGPSDQDEKFSKMGTKSKSSPISREEVSSYSAGGAFSKIPSTCTSAINQENCEGHLDDSATESHVVTVCKTLSVSNPKIESSQEAALSESSGTIHGEVQESQTEISEKIITTDPMAVRQGQEEIDETRYTNSEDDRDASRTPPCLSSASQSAKETKQIDCKWTLAIHQNTDARHNPSGDHHEGSKTPLELSAEERGQAYSKRKVISKNAVDLSQQLVASKECERKNLGRTSTMDSFWKWKLGREKRTLDKQKNVPKQSSATNPYGKWKTVCPTTRVSKSCTPEKKMLRSKVVCDRKVCSTATLHSTTCRKRKSEESISNAACQWMKWRGRSENNVDNNEVPTDGDLQKTSVKRSFSEDSNPQSRSPLHDRVSKCTREEHPSDIVSVASTVNVARHSTSPQPSVSQKASKWKPIPKSSDSGGNLPRLKKSPESKTDPDLDSGKANQSWKPETEKTSEDTQYRFYVFDPRNDQVCARVRGVMRSTYRSEFDPVHVNLQDDTLNSVDLVILVREKDLPTIYSIPHIRKLAKYPNIRIMKFDLLRHVVSGDIKEITDIDNIDL